MGVALISGAMLACSFGTTPSQLMVTSQATVLFGGGAAATMGDCAPLVNIKPFGMCMSLANPQVATATTAALGVLTPMPCLPATTPWTPAGSIIVGAQPLIDNSSSCMCAYAGKVTVISPGQAAVTV